MTEYSLPSCVVIVAGISSTSSVGSPPVAAAVPSSYRSYSILFTVTEPDFDAAAGWTGMGGAGSASAPASAAAQMAQT